MKDNSQIDRLRGPVLRSVSRSFYLSVRLLPTRLRDPIALAYLLARATDTIADTTEISPKLRSESLRILVAAIQGKAVGKGILSLRDSFTPRQTSESERALIQALPAYLEWLETLPDQDRSDIRRVLEKINCGQSLDVDRFGEAEGVHALPTASDLDEYTYLVAGCVGELWTEICFRHLGNFADRSKQEMLALGREYGQGLQLINILRDAGNDLRNGRCYFPEDELRNRDLAPGEILREPSQIRPILDKWRERAESGVAAGLEYACAIGSKRVRIATALPALIGARTLSQLREAGSDALQQNVKIDRIEVRRIIRTVFATVGSRRSLRKLFARLSL